MARGKRENKKEYREIFDKQKIVFIDSYDNNNLENVFFYEWENRQEETRNELKENLEYKKFVETLLRSKIIAKNLPICDLLKIWAGEAPLDCFYEKACFFNKSEDMDSFFGFIYKDLYFFFLS